MYINSIKNDINLHYQNYLIDIYSNLNVFEAVRRISKHKKRSFDVPKLYSDGNKSITLTSSEQICEEFANLFEKNHSLTVNNNSKFDCFVGKSMEIINNFDKNIIFDEKEGIGACIETQKELKATNNILPVGDQNILTCAQEEKKIIENKNIKKSTGRDNMTNYIIKFFDIRVILLLTTFFNHVLSIHHFPKIWNEAIVIPIPKSGKDKSIITNYLLATYFPI